MGPMMVGDPGDGLRVIHVIKGVKVKIEYMYMYPIQPDFDFNHLVHFFPPETWPNIATVILIVANKQYLIFYV